MATRTPKMAERAAHKVPANVATLCSAGLALFAAGCTATAGSSTLAATSMEEINDVAVEATAVSAAGEDSGYVAITGAPNGVLILIDVAGLSPGWHGVHLHQRGDCSDSAGGFMRSGPHINPDGRAHGLMNAAGPHLADLPNIHAGADGRATAEMFRAGVSLSGKANPSKDGAQLLDADGFALIIHESADDHVSQPIGGSGARVICAAFTR